MSSLVFFLEEQSAQAMLEGILPRLLPADMALRYIIFQGKQDLGKRLVHKMRNWQEPNTQFVIIRDQDSHDCRHVKQELLVLAQEAGQQSPLIRIACHELETFFLGDLQAIELGLGYKNLAKLQKTQLYRNPDRLNNAYQELKKLAPSYQKIGGSRAIAPHLRLDDSNTSESFQHLISGISRLVAAR